MTKSAKMVLGILGAAAAGVVIGMLIAPEKGSKIRKKLKKTADEWADNVSNLFHKGQDGVADLKETIKRKKEAME